MARRLIVPAFLSALLAVTAPAPAVAACGDGTLDGGEACDEGPANGTPTSCCDASCQLEPVTKTCRPAADFCDAPETCTGASPTCPVDAVRPVGAPCGYAGPCVGQSYCDGTSITCAPGPLGPDSDGDGQCDAVDPCTNVGGAQDFVAGQRLIYKSRPTQRKFLATFDLPAGTSFADLDPATRGSYLFVDTGDPQQDNLLGAYLTAGTYSGVGGRGWQRGTSTWKYVDRQSAPYSWVKRLTIYDRSRTRPGRITVKANGKVGGLLPTAAAFPLHVIVIPGDVLVDSPAGRCGEGSFAITDCELTSSLLICVK